MRRVADVLVATALVLFLLGALSRFFNPPGISELFFWFQDAPVLLIVALVVSGLARLDPPPFTTPSFVCDRSGWLVVGLALSCGLVSWVGVRLVYDDYALSMDEFLARFDSITFSQGKLFGQLPSQWVPFRGQLQTMFMVDTPAPDRWSSAYLPMNAAMRGAARVVRLDSLLNPAWVTVSILATYGIARRLWPDDRRLAIVAAGLLATSSQLLVNGMTTYAMPAHLALNLAWLWCFLRGGKGGHAAALAIGFVACGLHQVAFHPLFVAPFVLQLWLERRWLTAAAYTLAYAVFALFWIRYWQTSFEWAHLGALTGVFTGQGFVGRVVRLVLGASPVSVALMAKNLLRFAAWQNLIATPLFVLSVVGAWKSAGAMRSMLLGLAFTTLTMLVVLPFQGHGWGYRYLHGLLGSFCLLAALGWRVLTRQLEPHELKKANGALLGAAGVSLLVLFPVRMWQVHHFVHPYAQASRTIERMKTDVVLVDHTGVWYGADLVRNDPFLRTRPIVLDLPRLSVSQIRSLCQSHSVTIFDRDDAKGSGIRTFAAAGDTSLRAAAARNLLSDLNCGQNAAPAAARTGQ